MAEFTLPKNSVLTEGKTFKAACQVQQISAVLKSIAGIPIPAKIRALIVMSWTWTTAAPWCWMPS